MSGIAAGVLAAWLATLADPASAAASGACSPPAAHAPRAVSGLSLLGVQSWPHETAGAAASVPGADRPAGNAAGLLRHFGGISGIDHDPRSGRWWLLSDDRSEHAPARVYEATLPISGGGPGQPELLAVHTLRRADGQPFARFGSADSPRNADVADGEALRLDPCSNALVWASEGDPAHGHPAVVHRSDRSGRHLGTWPLPSVLSPSPDGRSGSRPNRSFEGLAFTPDGSALWLALEAPLLQDGPLPTAAQGAALRFTRLAREGGAQQYVYPLEPITHEARGGQRRADQGVSEILAVDADTLLVVERGGHEVDEGVFAFSVRLYLAHSGGADDVLAWPTLAGRQPKMMAKHLLLDLATLTPGPVDNIEAAAWGPRLADGRATLLLVSDDNFSPRQRTQWWLFAVDER
ncbi:esterase-like activity of phytase family protein [Aquabacterium sp.]|uniref:esterase-like activity of phytase family protein n=1 Tax=Aquabacterium sp. TaxID=1872578 RepID=UPI002BB5C3AA|nr:esterase-like activity of phytase family protein [Aquabacterium sp.]HSW04080.1 esterase-like activity of phytase family protein [Aquabacterium sp.]